MNYSQALAYLHQFINLEKTLQFSSIREFKLERVSCLLRLCDNPQEKLKVVHVAGTKGKGSISMTIAQILAQAGYKTGLYTSPHLQDIKERIQISTMCLPNSSGFELISEEDFAYAVCRVKEVIESHWNVSTMGELSFFEVFTVVAAVYFVEQETDIVVLETGLGGRLDATNAFQSCVAVITPISLEHQHILGETLEKIAAEKMMIIKDKNQCAIIAHQQKNVVALIKKHCKKIGVDVKCFGEHFSSDDVKVIDGCEDFTYYGKKTLNHCRLSLRGEHQVRNAAVAIAVIEVLRENGMTISQSHIKKGLENVFWPGRFECRRVNGRDIILDGAHNMDSAQALINTFKRYYPDKNAVLIFGVSSGKDLAGMCAVLNKIVDRIIVTKSDHPRAQDLSLKEVQLFFKDKMCYNCKNLSEAMTLAFEQAQQDDVILVSGSLYLVSEARAYLACINTKV